MPISITFTDIGFTTKLFILHHLCLLRVGLVFRLLDLILFAWYTLNIESCPCVGSS